METQISSILSNLSGDNLEVELRMLVDKRLKMPKFIKNSLGVDATILYFQNLIRYFCSASPQENPNSEMVSDAKNIVAITETMNFIQNLKSQKNFAAINPDKRHHSVIKQLNFKNGIQQKDDLKLYSKENLVDPIFITDPNEFGVKLGINREISLLKAPDMKFTYDNCRIKLRFSIWPCSSIYPDLQDWRIDITLVKTVGNDASIPLLKRIRDTLFVKDVTAENFVENAPWNYADQIELEVEYVGKTPNRITEKDIGKVLNAIKLAEKRTIQTLPSNDLYELASIINPKKYRQISQDSLSLKLITPQAIELTKQQYFSDLKPHLDKFWMTDKADGMRSIIIIDSKLRIVNSHPQTLELPSKPAKSLGKCIADCELILDKKKGVQLYIFDVIMYDNKSLIDEPFSVRKSYIKYFEEIAPDVCFGKEFVRLSNSIDGSGKSHQISSFYTNLKRPYEIDGLIFTEDDVDYSSTKSFKWKPIDKMSIDFLVKKCPKQLLGISPYSRQKDVESKPETKKRDETLYFLFCGISQKQFERLNFSYVDHYKSIFLNANLSPNYFPIQFSPSDMPFAYLFWYDGNDDLDGNNDLDGKIVEMVYVNKWKKYRIRDDRQIDVETGKYYGNNIAVAETIWQNYKNPLTLEMLEETPNKSYFQEHDSKLHEADRSFNRFVHSTLFNRYISKADWVIDLGSGKGQDLFRYASVGVKHILFLEKDKDAITELLNRKHQYARGMRKANRESRQERMSIYVKELDLNESWERNIARIKASGIPIPNNGVSIIFCGFALHYLVGNAAQMSNIAKFIEYLLAPTGKFIYTAFDGKAVFERLKEGSGRYLEMENDIMKYDIRQKYKSLDFTGINQQIDVLLPFSMGDYYTEYLISNERLAKQMAKLTLKQTKYASFATYFADFKKQNKKHILSEIDQRYLTLYFVSIYEFK